jgi:hypothetical protein
VERGEQGALGVIENGKETQGGRWNPMQKLNSRPNIRNIRYGEQMVLILPSVLWWNEGSISARSI